MQNDVINTFCEIKTQLLATVGGVPSLLTREPREGLFWIFFLNLSGTMHSFIGFEKSTLLQNRQLIDLIGDRQR